MMSHPAEQITNGVAVAGVTSPLWLTWLANVSQIAALVVPILGAAWLLMQMYFFLRNRNKK